MKPVFGSVLFAILTGFGSLMGEAREPVAPVPDVVPSATSQPAVPTPAANPVANAAPSALPAVAAAAGQEVGGESALLGRLGEAQLDQALLLLQQNYVQPGALNSREIKRAQLAGLMARLGPGVRLLLPGEVVQPVIEKPFLAEVIDGRIAYVRPEGITLGDLVQMDALLQEWAAKDIRALILDLRSIPYGGDFETAAEFARRFVAKGKLLFRLDKPSAKQERIFTANQEPLFSGSLIVLTDGRTAGAAEVLAAVLRKSADAMILGMPTAGEPVEFAVFPLGGGTDFRMAVAEAILPDNERGFLQGFAPDLALEIPPAEQKRLFQLASEKGLGDLIFEKERPRFNEAALLANANPEISDSAGAEIAPPPPDRVLQRAVDILTALQFFSQ